MNPMRFDATPMTQRGMTLVELLVSLAVSSLIVIAAAAFLLGSTQTRNTQDAAGELQDTARYVADLMTRNIQQAGFQNYSVDPNGNRLRRETTVYADGEPDLRGWNNSAAGADIDHGSHDRSTNRVNNSDTIVVRFQGFSSTTPVGTTTATVRVADGSIIDCRGNPQAEVDGSNDRAYSIFEIRQSTGAEPELRCKYKNSSGTFVSEVIARGVESLQALYGVDSDCDTYPDTWLTAKQVDAAGPYTCVTPWTSISAWQQVRSIRVGLILRSASRVTAGAAGGTFTPLGANFTGSSTTDPGATITISDDGRLRRLVTFTVNLRNSLI